MYDLIIIGGGPAGSAAGVYAARKKLKTLLITDTFGGQSVVSPDIQNWIGTPHISGNDLAQALEDHVREYAGDHVDVNKGEFVENIEQADEGFSVVSNKETYQSKAVLITTGSARRKLDVPGAETFENKGITYCASCDGPMFAGKDTVVIGGGNAGFETAAQLLEYANSVTLLHKNEKFKADPITVEKVLANPKMTAHVNANTEKIEGEDFVEAVIYRDTATDEQHKIEAGGVFVEIGNIPTTGFAKNLVDLDEYKRIIIDPKRQRTSVEGVWSAGDSTDTFYHQNNIAAGDAVRALEDIYLWLRTQ